MKRSLFFALLLTLVAASAAATDFAGPNVVIPMIGRTHGAFGTEWRTDLVVTNAARSGVPVLVGVTFIRNGESEDTLYVTLEPRASTVLRDVVLETFGYQSAVGMLRVDAESPTARISARARVYNVGSPIGQYGQIAQGIPISKLARDTYLPGLSGVGGNRTNVGVANPADVDAYVFVSLFEESGDFRGGFSIVVPARTVKQMNDIFRYFDDVEPLDGAAIQVYSAPHGVYAYASIVRNDTGDADFITGTGVDP